MTETVIGRGVIPVELDRSRVGSGLMSLQGGLKKNLMKVGAAGGIAAGVGMVVGFGKKAVGLEADFSKTMNVLQATTDAPKRAMGQLSRLAMKMGADTVFSASEAAKAMLELARGGITPAQIQAGALKGTLTLAAAGELDMATAANIAVKTMGQFNLAGKDMAGIAAALAGGANASSASVQDMAMALSQAGLAAKGVGFSVQETTAILASFSNQGLEGSDAGTSLKTMLDRLQPATKRQAEAMRNLGLMTADGRSKFVNANGTFKSAVQVAGLLQNATKDLSDAEAKRLITQAFGSDAQRAATALANEGAKGLAKLQKQTSDTGAAQKQANANMKGTAGAIEQLKGSIETATLKFGLLVQPAVVKGLGLVTDGVNAIAPAFSKVGKAMSSGGGGGIAAQIGKTVGAVGGFVKSLMPTFIEIGQRFKTSVLPAFRGLVDTISEKFLPAFRGILPVVAPVARFIISVIGSAVIGAIKGAIQFLKGIINVIAGVFNLIKAIVTGKWGEAWAAVKQILGGVLDAIIGAIKVWFNLGILSIFKKGALKLLGGWKALWNGLKNFGKKALTGIKNFINKILGAIARIFIGAVKAYLRFWKNLFKGLWGLAKLGFKVLRSAFGGAFAALKTVVSTAMHKIGAFFRRGWETIKGIGHRLADFVRKTIPEAFRKGRDAIGRIWDKLKRLARKPVEFIVNTVYNKGIRRVINLLPGVPNLKEIHFARGGMMPGYTPGRDVHRFYSPTAGVLELSGGEPVMRPEFGRAVGSRWVDRMNALARTGGPGAIRKALGFARGGMIPAAGSWNRHSGYPWARWAGDINQPGPGDYGNPVRAYKDGIVAAVRHLATSYGNHIRINHPGSNEQTLYAHLSRTLVHVGEHVRRGELIGRVGSSGNSSGPHLHFEVAGGQAPIIGGGGGSWLSSLGGFLGGLLSKAKNIASGVGDALPFGKWAEHLRNSNGWGPMLAKSIMSLAGRVKSWVVDKIKGLFGGGGDLVPGSADLPYMNMGSKLLRGVVRNMAGRFGWGSGGQWRALATLIGHESSWNPRAQNPTSSAYGLFQFLDSTWGTVGGRKTSNAQLQTLYGLRYIKKRYGSPAGAWGFWNRHHWYDDGGLLQSGRAAFNGSGHPERVLDPQTTRNFDQFTQALDVAVRRSPRAARVMGRDAAAEASGRRVELVVEGHRFSAWMREIADYAVRDSGDLAGTMGRMR